MLRSLLCGVQGEPDWAADEDIDDEEDTDDEGDGDDYLQDEEEKPEIEVGRKVACGQHGCCPGSREGQAGWGLLL